MWATRQVVLPSGPLQELSGDSWGVKCSEARSLLAPQVWSVLI
jgi:hypothetical protein